MLLGDRASQIGFRIQDPGIGGSGIKQGSDQLRRVTDIHLRNISVVFKISLEDVGLDLLAFLIDRAVGNIIDLQF